MKFLRELKDALKKENITLEVLRHRKHFIIKCKKDDKEVITTISNSSSCKFSKKRMIGDIKRGLK